MVSPLFEIFLLSVSLSLLEAEKNLERIGQANRKVLGDRN
jgi:hypothetical protein